MKKGVDGVKIGYYPSFASFELITIPIFEPNNYPNAKRFYLCFDPMPNVTKREEKDPPSNLENTEFAFRAYRDVTGFDASVYLYRGFYRKPYMIPDDINSTTKITYHYPQAVCLWSKPSGKGIGRCLSFEAGYYDSRQDRAGKDYTVPNSQTKFLIGYQDNCGKTSRSGSQYYSEYMHEYSDYKKNQPSGLPKDRKLYQLATLRLTQFLMHQDLKARFLFLPRHIRWRLHAESGG